MKKQLMHPESEVKEKAGGWESPFGEFRDEMPEGFTRRHLWRFFLVDLIIVMCLRLLYSQRLIPSLDAYVALTLAGKVALAGYLVWMIRDAREGWRAIGIRTFGKPSGWVLGILIYAAAYPLMHGAGSLNFRLMGEMYRRLGWGTFEPAPQDVSLILLGDAAAPAVRIALFLFAALFGPVIEELAFRGVGRDGFSRDGGAWNAAVWTGLLFGLYHFDPSRILPLSVLGFALAGAGHFSRTLWCPVILHVFHNAFTLALMIRAVGPA